VVGVSWQTLKNRVQYRRQLTRWTYFDVLVVLGVAAYAALFSARTISAYTSGASLFDLAAYAQGFWNALGNPPFFYSLEGETSRLARHFSPFFYVLLPFYWLKPDPTSLLTLQATSIALGAIPIYLLAQRRLGQPIAAAFALAYLANPAVNDINIQNDFHEIAFSLPTLLFALYLGVDGGTLPYLIALILALSTREEVAVTSAGFGIYLAAVEGRRTRGIVTILISLAWLVIVVFWVMPAIGKTGSFPMPDGYEYLGGSPIGVLKGILGHPLTALQQMTTPPKLEYVFWLLEPIAFLSLLAPGALIIAGPALAEVLLSTYPIHYRIFERYAAPIVPVVFFAAIIGAYRLVFWWKYLVASRHLAARPPLLAIAVGVLASTVTSQIVLRKLPTEIQFSPDAHGATALGIAASLPQWSSVVSEDHRLLPHLANRRYLYVLSPTSPLADYVIFDRKRPPISNLPPAVLRSAEQRYLGNPEYLTLRCEDGVYLLGREDAARRDGEVAQSDNSSASEVAEFGEAIALDRIYTDMSRGHPGGAIAVDLTWRALGRVGADYQVFVQLIDQSGRLRAQHDGAPQDQLCATSTWTAGLAVRDEHIVPLPSDLPPGRYELRVGLYSLADLLRVPVTGSHSTAREDYAFLPIDIRP
jgi:uncharacterized membrane protein